MKKKIPSYNISDLLNQKDWVDFEIKTFNKMEEPEIEDQHKHNFYEILWIESGETSQSINFKEYKVEAYSLFFISPNQVHQFNDWNHLKGGNILFTEDFFLIDSTNKNILLEYIFLDNEYFSPQVKLVEKEFLEIKKILNLMMNENKIKKPSLKILKSYLYIFLEITKRTIESKSKIEIKSKELFYYKKFKLLVEEKWNKKLKARDYAKYLGISNHHLNFITKKISGKKVTEILINRKLLEAKRLLAYTDLSITEITKLLLFEDTSYFGKLFRKYNKVSAVEFRKNFSDKYLT